MKPGTALRFELAAIAKRLDGYKATLFPRPDNHTMPVLSGLVSDRQWIAEAMGVEADRGLVAIQESQDSKLDPSTRNGVGAKIGLDATKPLDVEEMKFKRIRVPGEDQVYLDRVIGTVPSVKWRDAVG